MAPFVVPLALGLPDPHTPCLVAPAGFGAFPRVGKSSSEPVSSVFGLPASSLRFPAAFSERMGPDEEPVAAAMSSSSGTSSTVA